MDFWTGVRLPPAPPEKKGPLSTGQRAFLFKSSDEIDNILYRFSVYRAEEEHNIFTSWFTPYYDSGVGIHTYTKNRLWGYYENGLATHSSLQLLRSKSWFFIKIKETNEGKVIKELIVGDIYLILGIYLVLFSQLLNIILNHNPNSFMGLIFMLIFGFFFLRHSYNEQNKLYDDLIMLLNKLDN